MHSFAQTAEAVAATGSKNEKISIVADDLRSRPPQEAGLVALYLSGKAFPASDERVLHVGGAQLWRALAEIAGVNEAKVAVAFRKFGDLGSAAAELLSARAAARPASDGNGEPAPEAAPLTLCEVAQTFEKLSAARGPAARHQLLRELFSRAMPLEAKYLIKIMNGEMRIGFQESLAEEAIARAWSTPPEQVKRANMLLGDLPETVRLAAAGRLHEARMRLFHPIGFMLASPAESAATAFEQFSDAVVEDKYDGIRAQAHCSADSVRLFSRTLEDVTETFPELRPALRGFPEDVILDGEILAWDFGLNRAAPFSTLQKRLGRKRVTEAIIEHVPVVYVVFDVLYAGRELLLDHPLAERAAVLSELFAGRSAITNSAPGGAEKQLGLAVETGLPQRAHVQRAPAMRASSAAHLDELFASAQARGNEGLMIKDPASAYTPGRRGQSWLKLKRELATLDVVVTAVEYGNGKRAGVLSDYTFAVRQGERLLNVGKAYTGLTDAEIAEMSRWFLAHTQADHGHLRTVEPSVVIEVAFNAVMRSSRHDSGFALRFPRIVRLRSDKPASEIDTLERVEEICQQQGHMLDAELAPGEVA